ncbi:hypothetical protein ACF05W_03210 [Streptomyces lydicus]|uniref:hypothetical protein n=1 Tax=Streptomyces lydicus TaxID=47763 RepID=UPI003702B62E
MFYLGKEGTPDYGGYVVRVDGDPNPETWFAYEWDHNKRGLAWVAEAPTAEVAQTAVKGEFLCEVYRSEEKGHCPFPGAVVRSTLYKGVRLRTILCGEHSGVFRGWDMFPLEGFRETYGLVPDAPIIGERIVTPLNLPTIREAVVNAGTTTERNMWIALSRAIRPLADLHYWWGHFARYPVDVNAMQWRSARQHWEQCKEHAQGMYAVFAREEHGQENATLPIDLLRLVERAAVEDLKSRKGGKLRLRRQSQAIAMDLRFHLYASEPGAKRDTYPRGAGSPPVPVAYTEEEQAKHRHQRDWALEEWEATDPEGHRLWRQATASLASGNMSQIDSGWSALILERDGMRIVDPCRFCRECRMRNSTR